jgi:2-polyprenyl-3-methyl-5-hydroxy-6-metoxy-1,4-benzoquinol methylase
MPAPAPLSTDDSLPDNFEHVACPGCGGNRCAEALEVGNPSLGPQMYPAMRFRIVRCEDCGLHYTNPRPTLESLSRFYPTEYSPYQFEKRSGAAAAVQDGSEMRWSIRELVLRNAFGAPDLRPRGIRRTWAGAVALVRRPEWFGFGLAWRGEGRLLDFGCGSGKFLRRMSRLGWTCTGIDFSEMAVARAGSIAGVRAIHGTLPHAELSSASFDVVTLRHALEHVPDPLPILEAAWDLVAAGGLLLIQVPNFDSFDIHRFGEHALPLDLPRHLTHFTPGTLSAMLRRAGIDGATIEQRCHANWIRKAAKSTAASAAARGPGLYRSPWVCRWMAPLIRLRGQGNEILATAIK